MERRGSNAALVFPPPPELIPPIAMCVPDEQFIFNVHNDTGDTHAASESQKSGSMPVTLTVQTLTDVKAVELAQNYK